MWPCDGALPVRDSDPWKGYFTLGHLSVLAFTIAPALLTLVRHLFPLILGPTGLQLVLPVNTAHSEGDIFPPVSQNECDVVTQTKT